jgi:hypothetical protein
VSDLHLERFYTDEQREALVRTYEDPERSAADVVRLAELGELRGPDGRRLPAFDVKTTSLRSIVRRHRRRLNPGDLEAANRRLLEDLLRVASTELRALKAVKAGKRDMRKIAQLVTVQARIDAALQGAPTPAPVRMPPAEPERAIGALMAAHRTENGSD